MPAYGFRTLCDQFREGGKMPFGDLHKIRNPGLTCLLICLLMIPLSGCGEPAIRLEPVTITFACLAVDEEDYKELAQRFNEQHATITVEINPTPWEGLDNLALADVDVFVTWPEVLSGLQEQGDVLTVDPFIETGGSLDLSDFYPGTVELLSIEGRTWAVPAGVDVLVMFYSQDLFDQSGVPYPEIGWTWDDFLNSALAISGPDAGIFGYTTSGRMPNPSYFDAALFVYQHGGRLFDDLQGPARTTFDDPLTVEAVEWYASLYHEYDVAPTPAEARSAFGGGQYAFYDGMRHGKVGMWMGNLSERGGLSWQREWFLNWGMAPLPRDAQATTQADVEGYVISSQTQHPDACWEWIVFLSQQVTHRLMPARRSLAESAAYEQFAGEGVAAVARVSMEEAVLINPGAFAELGEAMDIFARAVGEAVDENLTAEEAMDLAQREAEGLGPLTSSQ